MTRHSLRRITLGGAALLIAALPMITSPLTFAECTPPPDPGPGVHHPVGADASTYAYDCDTGLWNNPHYVYDPSDSSTTATDAPAYTYNAKTGKYDSGSWIYYPASSQWVLSTFSVTTPPAGAHVIGGPTATTISNTGANSNNSINNNGGVTDGSSINNTGQGSNNSIDGNSHTNGTTNNTTGVHVGNQLNATSTTGNATVLNNTNAGGATSGDSVTQANIINMLQSSSNAVNGDTVTFVANIDGDVNGDLMFDPNSAQSLQNSSPVGDSDLTINNSTDASINNDIDLTAKSGDATVANNTNAGDAKSGNAKTIANVINMINSAVSSGKSFIGTININGNLNGDILIPDDFVDQLIAANVPTVTITNTGANSNNTVNTTKGSGNTTVNNTNNQGITNTVNDSAASGNANVSNNTNAGSATSGNAVNSITAFNLTGSNVIGCNAMLVFVNVVGSWVGMIVNAPAGATAAGLGSCVSQSSNGGGNSNSTLNNNSNLKITNNIKGKANSGNATVSANTNGGNATSGDSENATNLLNIENSSLSFSGWFGILFINVFGHWNGSFGVNTAAGDPIDPAIAGTSIGTPGGFASFAPGGASGTTKSLGGGGSGAAAGGGTASSISNTGAGSNNQVLAAARIKTPTPQTATNPTHVNWIWATVGSIAFVLFVIGDRLYALRRR